MSNPVVLWPVSTLLNNPVCQNAALGGVEAQSNPQMFYNITLGAPTATSPAPNGFQTLIPPFSNLAALAYEVNSVGPLYGWNPGNATWNAI